MKRQPSANAWMMLSALFAIGLACLSSARVNAADAPILAQQKSTQVDAQYEEGVHYKKYSLSVTENPAVEEFMSKQPEKIKVLEFYNYACHWCQNLEPYVLSWLTTKPEFVEFYRIPVVFQPSWRILAKIYFAAESLGVVDKIHEPLFKAVQQETLADSKDESIVDFVGKQGIDKEAFLKAYHSFAIDNRLRWANNMAKVCKVMSIPTIVVITSKEAFYTQTSLAGSEAALFEVVNQLSKKEHLAYKQNQAKSTTHHK